MAKDKRMTTHRNAKATQRVANAWAMRVRGATWDEIARALGYANPANAVRAVRNFTGTLPQPETAELRDMWRERLEYLWPLAVRDVENARPGATRAAVAVAHRAAQLDGLDAPTKFEVTPGEVELQRIVDALVMRSGHAPIEDADVIELDVIEAPSGDGDGVESSG